MSKQKNIFLLLLFAVSFPVNAQNGSDEFAQKFINTIIYETDKAIEFVSPVTIAEGERLGIKYIDVRDKFLPGYSIDKSVKNEIVKGNRSYSFTNKELEEDYSVITFNAGDYTRSFYFRENKLVQPAEYFTRNWLNIESRYFSFRIEKMEDLNFYASRKLDAFVDRVLELLEFEKTDIKLLETQKINYYLCSAPEMVEQITGNEVRGMYNIGSDAIITNYNSHYHEVAHLLINFKLKTLHIYTLPLLLEGFATAVGGRGGVSGEVTAMIGALLLSMPDLDYTDFLSRSGFYGRNSSVAYPIAAFYNKFLFEELDVIDYLRLYRDHSATLDEINAMKLKPDSLPPDSSFRKYFAQYNKFSNIIPDQPKHGNLEILSKDSLKIIDTGDFYFIKTAGSFFISPRTRVKNYVSRRFKKFFPDEEYNGQKYLLMVDGSEIGLYNLYTNEVTAAYYSNFIPGTRAVPYEEGYYYFMIRKDLFEEKLVVCEVEKTQ